MDPNSKWKSLEEYLKKKSEALLSDLKGNAKAGNMSHVRAAAIRMDLIDEIIAYAESLDRAKESRGRATPTFEKY